MGASNLSARCYSPLAAGVKFKFLHASSVRGKDQTSCMVQKRERQQKALTRIEKKRQWLNVN